MNKKHRVVILPLVTIMTIGLIGIDLPPSHAASSGGARGGGGSSGGASGARGGGGVSLAKPTTSAPAPVVRQSAPPPSRVTPAPISPSGAGNAGRTETRRSRTTPPSPSQPGMSNTTKMLGAAAVGAAAGYMLGQSNNDSPSQPGDASSSEVPLHMQPPLHESSGFTQQQDPATEETSIPETAETNTSIWGWLLFIVAIGIMWLLHNRSKKDQMPPFSSYR